MLFWRAKPALASEVCAPGRRDSTNEPFSQGVCQKCRHLAIPPNCSSLPCHFPVALLANREPAPSKSTGLGRIFVLTRAIRHPKCSEISMCASATCTELGSCKVTASQELPPCCASKDEFCINTELQNHPCFASSSGSIFLPVNQV